MTPAELFEKNKVKNFIASSRLEGINIDPAAFSPHLSVKLPGGLVLASNYSACRGWNGTFDTVPGLDGDMMHFAEELEKQPYFDLKENIAYLGNSTFVHEGLIVKEPVNRQLFRLTFSDKVFIQ